MSYEVAIVGTGEDPETRDRTGFAMAYRHAAAYRAREDCHLAACADIDMTNAKNFAEHYDISGEGVFQDHKRLLREVNPDLVSVCVPPAVHAEIVLDAATIGDVKAIHCEKPMATQWTDCKEMVDTCAQQDVQLTFGHQRRFAVPVTRAKSLLEQGEIGQLRRLEWSEVNLFDAGSHVFDLCDLFVGGTSPSWVLAGVDASGDNRWFGALNSSRAIVHWGYENGVHGLASTADGAETAVDAYLRLIGTDGTIEIQPDDGPPLRLRTDNGWQTIDTDGESLYGPQGSKLKGAIAKLESFMPGSQNLGPERPNYARAINDAIESLESGKEPQTAGSRALRSTELIFGAWESARKRRQVQLPIGDVGNPLEAIDQEAKIRAQP